MITLEEMQYTVFSLSQDHVVPMGYFPENGKVYLSSGYFIMEVSHKQDNYGSFSSFNDLISNKIPKVRKGNLYD